MDTICMMSDMSQTTAMTRMTHSFHQHPRSPSWVDDMAEVAANAHKRQPSLMMIVLPLVEDEEASVRCDDLHASIYDFDDCFQQQQEEEEQDDYDSDDDDDRSECSSDKGIPHTIFTTHREETSSSFSLEEDGDYWTPLAAPAVPPSSPRVESPRCVATEMVLSSAAVSANKIPVLTDLMKSTSLSPDQKLRHKRSRNRAMSDQDFGRTVLPQLYLGGTAA